MEDEEGGDIEDEDGGVKEAAAHRRRAGWRGGGAAFKSFLAEFSFGMREDSFTPAQGGYRFLYI